MKTIISYNALSKLSLALSFVFLSAFVQHAAAQEVITVQRAIEITLQNNLQVKQSRLNQNLSEENLAQSKNALLPSVNGNSGYNINFGRSINPTTNEFLSQRFSSLTGGVSAGVGLFQGHQKVNLIKQNKLLLDADKTNTEKVKNDLILQVITSYLQILYNKDFLVAAQQQLAVSKQQLAREQQLLDAGNKTLADLSQAKSQVATSELNVTNADNALAISYLTLAQLMDIPPSTVYRVEAPILSNYDKPLVNYKADEVYQGALSTFPDIKLAALRTEAAKKGMDIAKGAYYPSLSFAAGLSTNYSSGRQRVISITPNGFREIGRTETTNERVLVADFTTVTDNYKFLDQLKDNFGQYVGLSLQIPIFNGFNVRTSVRKAKINYLQNQNQEQLAKNNLSKVIYQAVADLRAAESRYASTTKVFQAQKDAFGVIEQRYAVGLVNSLDFNTSQTNLNKAEIDMIQARYDIVFRAKVIDYYLGQPIVF
ncbi:MAG: TolC family protein [Candidatus Pedobacter colombiensis]|uniref:TolC family protein n=1 Tax=Candidatus Pedobacter colombiensis TaxID=3121371 RepID=A0AAJ5W8B0_9SPHI|nr:TolC family protein [Pedobacter sp.]WEK19911.1 MAG: TolC family protein [Pedobacter sp.]